MITVFLQSDLKFFPLQIRGYTKVREWARDIDTYDYDNYKSISWVFDFKSCINSLTNTKFKM
jgi:hypothetical protein